MKHLFTLSFLLFSVIAFTQDTTYTLDEDYYDWHQVDSKSWAILTYDTLHAATDDDTIVINLPHEFGTYFTGLLVVTMDTLALTSDLEGSYQFLEAQCEDDCPYFSIKTVTIPNLDVYTRDTIDIDDFKGQIMIIGTSGDGIISSWLSLKPKVSW